MAWWSWLIGAAGLNAIVNMDDPAFGLQWSPDDEAWIGESDGYRIAIGYSGTPSPSPELLGHVREFLGPNAKRFTQNLANARAVESVKYEPWAAEFAGLRVGMLHFRKTKTGYACLVDMVGGEPDRSWRVEFEGTRCLGFGFDT